MKTRLTETRLTYWRTNVILWFAGLFFMSIGGIFGYRGLAGIMGYNGSGIGMFAGFIAMCAIFLAVGSYLLYSGSVTKILFDRTNRRVSVTEYGLFGKKANVYAFETIKEIYLSEKEDGEGGSYYALGIRLVNGKTVDPTVYAERNRELENKYVSLANDFMQSAAPPGNLVSGSADSKEKKKANSKKNGK